MEIKITKNSPENADSKGNNDLPDKIIVHKEKIAEEVIAKIDNIFNELPNELKYLITDPTVLLLIAGLKAGTNSIPEEAKGTFGKFGFKMEKVGHQVITYAPQRLADETARSEHVPNFDPSQTLLSYRIAAGAAGVEPNVLDAAIFSFPESASQEFAERSTDSFDDREKKLKRSRYDGYSYYLPASKDVLERELKIALFFNAMKGTKRFREIVTNKKFRKSYDEYVNEVNRWNEEMAISNEHMLVGSVAQEKLLKEMGYFT